MQSLRYNIFIILEQLLYDVYIFCAYISDKGHTLGVGG